MEDVMLLEANISNAQSSSKGKEPAISLNAIDEIIPVTKGEDNTLPGQENDKRTCFRPFERGDPESPQRPKTGRKMTAELYQALRAENATPLARILGSLPDDAKKAMICEQVTAATDQTALHVAAMYGHEDVVREVLRFGTPDLLTAVDYMGYTPLHGAAKCGRAKAVEIMVNHAESTWPASSSQAQPPQLSRLLQKEVENSQGFTAVDLAARSGHLEVVKVFSSKYKNLLLANGKGCDPFYYATLGRHWDVVFHILSFEEVKAQSLVHKPGYISPLLRAIHARREDIAFKLIKMVPEYHALVDEDGDTPLHIACLLGMLKSVRLLLKLNPSAAYIRNKTKGSFPIHMAAKGGHIHVYKELMRYCPDLEVAREKDEMTVLHLAVQHQRLHFVRYVLETTKSDHDLINAKDVHGNTALHIAIIKDLIWIIFLLLDDKRTDVRISNRNRRFPRDIITSDMENLWGTPFSQKAAIYSAVMKAHGLDFNPDSLSARISHRQRSIPGPEVESKWRSTANNLLVAATLIATASFAAIFTIPGQFESTGSDQGLAHFRKQTLLKFFIVVDSLALFSSIITAILVIVATWTDTLGLVFVVPFALNMASLSFIAMCIAWIFALILMIYRISWELILVSSTGFILVMILLLIFLGYTSPALLYWRFCVVFRRVLMFPISKFPQRQFFWFSRGVRKWRIWTLVGRYGEKTKLFFKSLKRRQQHP